MERARNEEDGRARPARAVRAEVARAERSAILNMALEGLVLVVVSVGGSGGGRDSWQCHTMSHKSRSHPTSASTSESFTATKSWLQPKLMQPSFQSY